MPRVCCIKPPPRARETGAAEGLAKSEGKAPIDRVARVAKAPKALLGLRDLAESERVRKREAIVVGGRLDDSKNSFGSRRGLLDEPTREQPDHVLFVHLQFQVPRKRYVPQQRPPTRDSTLS